MPKIEQELVIDSKAKIGVWKDVSSDAFADMDDTTLKIAGKKFVDFVSSEISVIIVKLIGLYSGYITIWVIGAASERGGCFRWGSGVLHVIDKYKWRGGGLAN